MKRILLTVAFSLLFILSFLPILRCATITSLGSGDWNNVRTWTAVDRTGTITVNTVNTTVVGSGTSFTTQLAIGSVIYYGLTEIGIVASITNNTTLVLEAISPEEVLDNTYKAQIIPFPGDDVVIAHNIDGDGNISCLSLTINGPNILDMHEFNLTTTTINNSGTIDMHEASLTAMDIDNDTGTIRFSGANNGINIDSGTVEYYGDDQEIESGTYVNLVLSGTGIKTAENTLNILNTLDNGGVNDDIITLDMQGYVLGGPADIYIDNFLSTIIFSGQGRSINMGTIVYNGSDQVIEEGDYDNLVLSGTGTKSVNGDITATTLTNTSGAVLNMSIFTLFGDINNSGSTVIFSAPQNAFAISTGTVEYDGGDGQEVAMGDYYNLTISSSNTHVAVGQITVSGILAINTDATLDMSAYELYGTFTTDISGNLNINSINSPAIPNGKSWGGNVYYSVNAEQTVALGTYNNLILSGGESKTFESGTSIINGTMDISDDANAILPNGSNLNIAGNISSPNNGLITLGSGIINISGDWETVSLSTSSGTVNYNKNGNQNIAGLNYFNLQTSGTSGTKSLDNDMSIAGALTVGTGTTLNLNSNEADLQGTGTITGTLNVPSGSLFILNGSLADNNTIDVTGTFDCTNQVISGTGSFVLNNGASIKTANTDGIEPSGAFGSIQTSLRTFAPNADYEYNGTSAQGTGTGLPSSIGGNLIINNTAGVSLEKSITLNGTSNSVADGNTFTVNSTKTLNIGGTINLNSSGVIDNNGTIAGVGTIIGDLDNTGGILAPGNSPGTLHITGDYDGRGATHNFELSHNLGYDKLEVTGNILIDNTSVLNITFTGTTPSTSDIFDIFESTGGSVSGTFLPANINYPDGADFDVNYSADMITLNGLELPIELSKFTATKHNYFVDLAWSTSSELNNDFYSIERSADGKLFEEIGEVNATGTNLTAQNYSYTDERPLEGINYYRLKQVDYDKLFSYSPVRVVNIDLQSPFSIYPTLVRNNLKLQTSEDSDSDTFIELISSAKGSIIYKSNMDSGENEKEINTSELAPGSYIARIIHNQRVYNHKFIKQ